MVGFILSKKKITWDSLLILVIFAFGCAKVPELRKSNPPVNFEFENIQVVSEILSGSVAIQNNSFVAPPGYIVLHGSGIPPKIRPTSGSLLIVFGNLNVKAKTPKLEAIELMRGASILSMLEGVTEPKAGSELVFNTAKAQELNPGLGKLDQDKGPLKIGFVFRMNETNFNATDATLRISWRTETDEVDSMIIPLQLK